MIMALMACIEPIPTECA